LDLTAVAVRKLERGFAVQTWYRIGGVVRNLLVPVPGLSACSPVDILAPMGGFQNWALVLVPVLVRLAGGVRQVVGPLWLLLLLLYS